MCVRVKKMKIGDKLGPINTLDQTTKQNDVSALFLKIFIEPCSNIIY